MRLEAAEIIGDAHQPIEYADFPTDGLISIVRLMADGAIIEVAAIGREGVVGAAALLGRTTTPYRSFVQIEGHGFRIGIDTLLAFVAKRPEIKQVFLHYCGSLIVQTMQNVAYNGLHAVEQRCCR